MESQSMKGTMCQLHQQLDDERPVECHFEIFSISLFTV